VVLLVGFWNYGLGTRYLGALERGVGAALLITISNSQEMGRTGVILIHFGIARL
jgi:hypothetical protein